MSKQRTVSKKKQVALETYKFDTSSYVKIPTISKKAKPILRTSKKEEPQQPTA
jgi:hypothetical protein